MTTSSPLEAIFQKGGSLSSTNPAYELRESQLAMAKGVERAYQKGKIALFEAGTGVGKSFAYLIPAILSSRESGETTVISTHTIALQEQLLHKDIPLLEQALGISIDARIVRGMKNYLCIRRFQEKMDGQLLFGGKELSTLKAIEQWRYQTKEGTRTHLPLSVERSLWEEISVDKHSCTYFACPQRKDCFFFRARQELKLAKILIVNHHLLLADLKLRSLSGGYDRSQILPPYRRVIIDEAHHLEEISLQTFSEKHNILEWYQLLSLLGGERSGKLKNLHHALSRRSSNPRWRRLAEEFESFFLTEWPTMRKSEGDAIAAFFQSLDHFSFEGEGFRRLFVSDLRSSGWQEGVLYWRDLLEKNTLDLLARLRNKIEPIRELVDPKEEQEIHVAIQELAAPCRFLEERGHSLALLSRVDGALDRCEKVLFLEREKKERPLSLTLSGLSCADQLRKALFEPMKTVILTSATLSSGDDFSFFAANLGISVEGAAKERVERAIFPSPFDFSRQSLFLSPTDIPSPKEAGYLEAAAAIIEKAVQITGGGALILCTSYRSMDAFQAILQPFCAKQRLKLLSQREGSRSKLLSHFSSSNNRSILLATYSFWEGIDLIGDKLRLVIIAKLPFSFPKEPLQEARAEALLRQGRLPFFDLHLPKAVIRFKQGFGRLIRSAFDRGCVLSLDVRLTNSSFGHFFLRPLPPAPQFFAPKEQLLQRLSHFYAEETTKK